MPLLNGIAAMALLSNGSDQLGVDPQIDKQYAIVKQGENQPVALAAENRQGCTNSATFSGTVNQAGNIQIAIDQQGTTVVNGGQISTTAAGSSTNGVSIVATPTVTVQGNGQVRTITTPNNAVAGFWVDSSNLQRLKGMDRKVSVKFNNASANDVLKWLTKQNINFVANTDTLPKSKITVNLSNVPLHEALDSVADALGGAWMVKGSTLIFHTGGVRLSPFASTRGFMVPGGANAFESRAFQMKPLDGRAFTYKFDDKAFQDLGKLKSLDGKAFNLKWDDKQFKDFKKFDAFGFKKVDAKKFLDSMTANQKDLMKKQGYLKVSDLTDDQKNMLFENPKSELPKEFTFMLDLDGQKVTIKN